MPKQIYKIDQFHGGLNNALYPTDINDTEATNAQNIDFDSFGRVRLCGGTAQYNATVSGFSYIASLQPGYGLFFFSSDYKGADGTEADGEEETDYLIAFDNGDGKFQFLKMNSNGDAQTGSGAEPITLAGGGGAYPVYHVADGNLRISDAGFDASNKPLWYGYIDIDQFNGITNLAKDFNGWYVSNATPEKPSASENSTATFGGTSKAGLGIETHDAGLLGSATIGGSNMIDDACNIRISKYAKGDDITDYMHLDVGPGQAGALKLGYNASAAYAAETESSGGSAKTLTIDNGSGAAPYDLETLKDWFLGRQVYKSDGTYFGNCTRITDTTTMIFDGGLSATITDNDVLYIRGRWGRDSDSDVCINTHQDEGGNSNGASINATRGSYAIHWNSNENATEGANKFPASGPLAVDLKDYHDGTSVRRNISAWTTANKSLYFDIYMTNTLYEGFESNDAGMDVYISEADATLSSNNQGANNYATYKWEYLKKYITKNQWSTVELIPNEHTTSYSSSSLGISDSAPDDIDSITFNITNISDLNSDGSYHALNQILFDNFRYGETKNITPLIVSNWGDDGEKWNIWKSFVYENNQESLPKIYTKDGTATASETLVLETNSNRGIYVQFYFHYASSLRNLRIKGEKFYVSRHSETLEDQKLYHIADIDYEKGGKPWNTESYSSWSTFEVDQDGSSLSGTAQTPEFYIESPSILTYEIINGYRHDGSKSRLIGSEDGEGWKTSVVANRQTYIANVKTSNEQGTLVVEGDAMYKSYVNRFDCIPSDRKIEAVINDGDSIVKIEAYADRILQFKKQKMHIINVSQDIEFLEDTFMYKGVSHHSATCKTDFGIAWVNTNGVFFYDGKNVSNLLEKSGRVIISPEEWDKFLRHNKTSSGNRLTPMIQFLPKDRKLLVFDDITDTSTADPRLYIYHFVHQSWTTATHGVSDNSLGGAVSQETVHTLTVAEADNTNPAAFKAATKFAPIFRGTQKLGYDSGGTSEILTGDIITGADSAAYGTVGDLSINSGSFAGGDAAGHLYLYNHNGTFNNNEQLNRTGSATTANIATADGTNSNICTIRIEQSDTTAILASGTLVSLISDSKNFVQTYGPTYSTTSVNLDNGEVLAKIDHNSMDEGGTLKFTYDYKSLTGNRDIDKIKTNPVVDADGNCVWVHSTGTIVKWDDSPKQTKNVFYKTKFIDFGNPSQSKKIYKVYVTHRNAGTTIIGLYGEIASQKATSDQGAGELTNDFFFGYLVEDSGQSGNYITQSFSVPSGDLSGNTLSLSRAYSIRLYIQSYMAWGGGEPGASLDGIVNSNFNINDISIVYGLKPIK